MMSRHFVARYMVYYDYDGMTQCESYPSRRAAENCFAALRTYKRCQWARLFDNKAPAAEAQLDKFSKED